MMHNPFKGGPSPQQLLVLESSVFTLSERCFDMCSTSEQIIKSAQLAGDERQDFDQKFNDCISHCTISYIQTRQYLRDKLLSDIDSTAKKNDELYKSYYK